MTGSAAGRSGAGAAGSWTTDAGAVGPAVTGACAGTEPAADAAATGSASSTVLRVNVDRVTGEQLPRLEQDRPHRAADQHDYRDDRQDDFLAASGARRDGGPGIEVVDRVSKVSASARPRCAERVSWDQHSAQAEYGSTVQSLREPDGSDRDRNRQSRPRYQRQGSTGLPWTWDLLDTILSVLTATRRRALAGCGHPRFRGPGNASGWLMHVAYRGVVTTAPSQRLEILRAHREEIRRIARRHRARSVSVFRAEAIPL